MFSFKLKSLSWKGNEAQYSLLLLSIPFFIWLKLAALAPFVGIYVLISLVQKLQAKPEIN
jgi:hypothetical protein